MYIYIYVCVSVSILAQVRGKPYAGKTLLRSMTTVENTATTGLNAAVGADSNLRQVANVGNGELPSVTGTALEPDMQLASPQDGFPLLFPDLPQRRGCCAHSARQLHRTVHPRGSLLTQACSYPMYLISVTDLLKLQESKRNAIRAGLHAEVPEGGNVVWVYKHKAKVNVPASRV